MREGIKYNVSPQQEALNNRIFNKIMASDCPQRIKDGLTSYSNPINHPTTNEVMLPIDRDGYYWQWFIDELTPAELNRIEVIGSEWEPNLDD